MTDAPQRRLLPLLGATWLGLSLLHLLLQALAPRSILHDPLLPFWARAGLLATEGGLLAVVLLAGMGAFRGLSVLAGSRFAPALVVLRCLTASLLLLVLAVSWSMFWLSGQFLDGPGLRFAAGNFSSLLAYGAKVHPFLSLGLPWLLLAAAVAGSLLIPRWIDRLPEPGAKF